jgi:type I restriction enzyme, S subunit
VVRLQNIGWAKFADADKAYIDQAHARELGDHSVVADDLLIAGLGDEGHPVGRACVAPVDIGPAMVKADCFRFRLDRRRLIPHFAAYQLSAAASAAAGSLSTGSTRSRINLTATAGRKIALPPINEQETINALLDRETEKIDVLVAKKERLIGLLQERRAALIARAATKGLDRDVPMRDSGVQWLGEIPAHWEAARMWRVSTAISGGTPARDEAGYWDGDIPWVSPKDMKRRYIGSSEDCVTYRAVSEAGLKLIAPPVILIVVRGMILAHTFPVAITTNAVTINQDMKALTFQRCFDLEFVAWLLDGIAKGLLAAVVEEAAHGTRAIRMDAWRSVVVPFPPRSEQRAIVAFLDRETAKIDALVAKIREAIGRLKELRIALISAAVTGKIDVRGEAE